MFRVKRLLILHDQANANEPRSPVQIGEFGVDEISIGVIAFSDGPKMSVLQFRDGSFWHVLPISALLSCVSNQTIAIEGYLAAS